LVPIYKVAVYKVAMANQGKWQRGVWLHHPTATTSKCDLQCEIQNTEYDL